MPSTVTDKSGPVVTCTARSALWGHVVLSASAKLTFPSRSCATRPDMPMAFSPPSGVPDAHGAATVRRGAAGTERWCCSARAPRLKLPRGTPRVSAADANRGSRGNATQRTRRSARDAAHATQRRTLLGRALLGALAHASRPDEGLLRLRASCCTLARGAAADTGSESGERCETRSVRGPSCHRCGPTWCAFTLAQLLRAAQQGLGWRRPEPRRSARRAARCHRTAAAPWQRRPHGRLHDARFKGGCGGMHDTVAAAATGRSGPCAGPHAVSCGARPARKSVKYATPQRPPHVVRPVLSGTC